MRLTIPRSQGKQIYYDARKSHWGDLFPHQPKHRPVLRYTGPKTKSEALMSVHKDAADEENIDAVEEDRQFEGSLRLINTEPRSTKVAKVKRRERARGGEGALKKVGVKSAVRAGWGGVVEGLKEEDRKRRKERRQERGAKDVVEM